MMGWAKNETAVGRVEATKSCIKRIRLKVEMLSLASVLSRLNGKSHELLRQYRVSEEEFMK